MYRICIFYLYDLSLVCCKALWSNKVEVEDDDERNLPKVIQSHVTVNLVPRFSPRSKWRALPICY